jgi:hypothetical protein
MKSRTFEFVTDTATLTIFDPAAIRHRSTDTADWWTIHSDALEEINACNIAIIDLGADGRFDVRFGPVSEEDAKAPSVSMNLKCPSKTIFVGAGEEITGDGLEPECLRGGTFIRTKTKVIVVHVSRQSDNSLLIDYDELNEATANEFSILPRLD